MFDRRRKVWNFLFCENGARRTKLIGALREFPSKASAWRQAESIRQTVSQKTTSPVQTVRSLVEQYRMEKMPARASTKRGYDAWIDNHILPRWGVAQCSMGVCNVAR